MKFLILSLFIFSSVQAVVCETPTKEGLLSYMNEFVNERMKVTGVDSEALLKSFTKKYAECESEINANNVAGCFENLKNFSRRKIAVSEADFAGFEVSRDDYFNSRPKEAYALPEELQGGIPDNYRKLAKDKGWKVIEYRSRTVGNPGRHGNGRSYNRLLILVEGSPYDKYIQFTLPNENGKPQQLVDFISVDKSKSPKEITFNQFDRDIEGKNPKPREFFDSCFSCHPNGMRNLSPAPGSVSKEDTENLDYMNNKMDSYKKMSWGKAVVPEHDGPALGEAQGCVRCHNGYTGQEGISRGALTNSTAGSHIRHKVEGDASMPVADYKSEQDLLDYLKNVQLQLSEPERKELFNELYIKNSDDAFSLVTYQRILKFMNEKGKLSNKDFTKMKFVLNGNPDYPNCLGDENCFQGLNKRTSESYNIKDRAVVYESFKKWATEGCDFGEPVPNVNENPRTLEENSGTSGGAQSTPISSGVIND